MQVSLMGEPDLVYSGPLSFVFLQLEGASLNYEILPNNVVPLGISRIFMDNKTLL